MSNLNSITKLTEFPRLEQKEKADGLLSKFMWWRKPDLAGPTLGKLELPNAPPTSVVSQVGDSASQSGVLTKTEENELHGQKRRPSKDESNHSSTSQQQPLRKISTSSPMPAYYRSDSTLSNRSTNQSPDIMDGSISPFTFEARTLPNVLRRISSLIAMGTNNQTDIKKYWMPDSVSKECYECAEKFTTFRRKHHCRICGQIFCSRCCNQEIPGKIIGYSGDLRVCTYCSKIVLSYLQTALSSDMSDDLRIVQEDLQNRFGSSDTIHHGSSTSYGLLSSDHPTSYRSLPRRKISMGYQEERFATTRSTHDNVFDSIVGNSNSVEDKQKSLGDFVNLKILWEELTHPVNGIDWATHRHNMMKNYHSCVVGSELVDWLLAQRKITWRGQGIQIGQMLIDASLIECVSQSEQVFLDAYALYRPVLLPLPMPTLAESSEKEHDKSDTARSSRDSQDPLWVKQISTRCDSDEDCKARTDYSSDVAQIVSSDTHLIESEDTKARLPSTASMYSLDLNLSENTVSISKPKNETGGKGQGEWDPYNNQSNASMKSAPRNLRKNNTMSSITTETMTDEFLQKTLQLQKDQNQGKDYVAPTGWHNPQQLTSDNELIAFQRLCNAFIRHENVLLNQLLENMNLSQSWADVILSIVHKVTDIVRPDVRHADDEMDIRHYVRFKKVCGGVKEDCRIVNGVVCTKNIANRGMRSKLKDPSILLIRSSIDYQRFENRFLSLEPLMMQEYDYLRNTVARISNLQPDLVLVENTVSRLAQDLMLEQGITLVINVKPCVMERVARCTQAVITTSADAQIGVGRPQLGMCHNFYVENFRIADGISKNLMFFDGCAMHLGCTVILRGGNHQDLMKVKRIISLLTFVAYNWRLERSYHIDAFAIPPERADPNVKRERSLAEVLESPGESEDFVSAADDEFDGQLVSGESTNETDSPVMDQNEQSEQSLGIGTGIGSGTETVIGTETGTGARASTGIVTHEKKKITAKSEICDDFSDPLQSYLVEGNKKVFHREDSSEKLIVQFVPDPSKYSLRACIDQVRLSASPFIRYTVPYLETEAGKNCELRKFFPDQIYWTSLMQRGDDSMEISGNYHHNFDKDKCNSSMSNKKFGTSSIPKIAWKPPHPFTSMRITSSISADHVQASLADFRRKGGRLDFGSLSEGANGNGNAVVQDLIVNSNPNVTDQKTSCWDGRVDCLDPFRHQKLSVLFCSYSSISCNYPCFCVNPWVVNMDLYGRHDISLGMFLERYCFRKTYHCPARQCDTPMLQHLRRFVHEDGCIQVASKELESPILGSGENILMWNWCYLCKTVSPIVPMSVDAWSLSFAKYLELRFHGFLYKRRGFDQQCSHSLHHDYVHYFAQRNIISWFKYTKIKLWEICLPSTILTIKKEPKSIQQLIDDVKVVAITGHGVYSNILEALMSVKETWTGVRAEEVLTSLLDQLKAERMVFRSKIEEIQINLSVPTSEAEKINKKEADTFLWKVTDSIGFLRSTIAETIQAWNTRLQDLLSLRKKEEKQAKVTAKLDNDNQDGGTKAQMTRMSSDPMLPSFSHITSQAGAGIRELDESLKSAEVSCLESSNEFRKERDRGSLHSGSGSTLDMSISGVLDELTNVSILSTDEVMAAAGSCEDLLGTTASSNGNNNNMESNNKGVSGRSTTASPPSPSQSIRSERQRPTPEHHERSKSDGAEKILRSNMEVVPQEDSPDFKIDGKKLGSNAVKTLISHFAGPAVGQVIQSPWMNTDHFFLAALSAIPISVHESEPSSVVAFALSSHEYKAKLADFNKTVPGKIMKSLEDEDFISGKKAKYSDSGTEEFQTLSGLIYTTKTSESIGDKPVLDMDLDEKDRDRNAKVNANIEVQFGSSTAKFYCRVYFAEQFRQLRALCLGDVEEFYIRSISHCISWNANGGKSGSTFCKTVDDRFVVKQMSKFEIQSFLDFAPNYFEYVRGCFQTTKPTVLAKILGVYRIGFRNTVTNAQSKMDILIMENLFYERNISQKFDLKGSIRNRLATVSGKEQEDLVLLDENLVNMACENPLYIRPHTKAVLTMALGNDSQFLSSQMVMDYSLLVGFDENKNELVVGIIDYIRTFTWDKKIETIVKSSGILGGQGKMPTVVSPEEYQTRFCEAMDRYFLLVPDRWMGLGLGVDS